MNNERIQEIKRRLAEATPGPWTVDEDYGEDVKRFSVYQNPVRHNAAITGWGSVRQTKENAEFIANAPEDIAYLLSEVERLQTENERLSNEMDSMMISLEDRDPYAASKYWTYLLDEKNQLVEALRWYADNRNYKLGNQTILGEKARTALSHLKGE